MRNWASTNPAGRTRSLARRCRVPGESDDSKIAVQRFLCGLGIPTALDREFARHDSYARHRPIQLRALWSDRRNPVCSSPTDADGEICSLQRFGSANAAIACAQDQLPSFATNERDSRPIILLTSAVFERESPLTLVLSPQAGRGESYIHCCVFSCSSETRWLARSVRLRENKGDTARYPASRVSNASILHEHR